jgi:hypothetical protein
VEEGVGVGVEDVEDETCTLEDTGVPDEVGVPDGVADEMEVELEVELELGVTAELEVELELELEVTAELDGVGIGEEEMLDLEGVGDGVLLLAVLVTTVDDFTEDEPGHDLS